MRGDAANGPCLTAEASGVTHCLAGCCPHAFRAPGSTPRTPIPGVPGVPSHGGAAGCPPDVPDAPLPERVVHLYMCQELSTYRVGEIVGIGRQRVTRLLHQLGAPVKPRGAGRPRRDPQRGPFPDPLLADLYLTHRLTCAEIAALTQIPARTVRDRLAAHGVRMRTKGRLNREDRVLIEPDMLAEMYVNAGLSSQEIGDMLGVSRRVVLRAAHDEGLPVRVGGPTPEDGPAEIELINALYADPDVRHALERHAVPEVPAGGPIWQRFPIPLTVSDELARDLYESCGLATSHIELLTGQPADTVRSLLRADGVALRSAGGRSPFLRRWRARQSSAGPRVTRGRR